MGGSLLLLFGGLSIFRHQERSYNWAKPLLPTSYTENIPTYRRFFSEALMTQIKEDLGGDLSIYRVVSLGIHPSV